MGTSLVRKERERELRYIAPYRASARPFPSVNVANSRMVYDFGVLAKVVPSFQLTLVQRLPFVTLFGSGMVSTMNK